MRDEGGKGRGKGGKGRGEGGKGRGEGRGGVMEGRGRVRGGMGGGRRVKGIMVASMCIQTNTVQPHMKSVRTHSIQLQCMYSCAHSSPTIQAIVRYLCHSMYQYTISSEPHTSPKLLLTAPPTTSTDCYTHQ